MNRATKKTVFLSVVSFLLLLIVGLAILFALSKPEEKTNETGVQLLNKTAEAGNIFVKDIYDGEMQIPRYDIPLSTYATDKFVADESGVMSYENGKITSTLGFAFKNRAQNEVDWVKVKNSGVDFVLLRVGYRYFKTGEIIIDTQFSDNIQGALDAGLDVGVYFFSQAITEQEAIEEAETVLQQIKNYQVKYPVMIKWYVPTKVENESEVRTKGLAAEEITNLVDVFCKKIKSEGYTPGFFANKTSGYETLNLSKLAEYDLWYSEYQASPAFYYDFKLWEYSSEAKVAGVEDTVEMCIALKSYH